MLSAKLVRIKSNATDHTDIDRCNAVLHKLFTACDPSMVTCSNPNVESFQLSTEQVCAAVDTPTKLLFETIGDEYDGFIDESADSKCKFQWSHSENNVHIIASLCLIHLFASSLVLDSQMRASQL